MTRAQLLSLARQLVALKRADTIAMRNMRRQVGDPEDEAAATVLEAADALDASLAAETATIEGTRWGRA